VDEQDATVTEVRPVHRGTKRLRREQTDGASEQRTDKVRDRDGAQAHLEHDDEDSEQDAELGVRQTSGGERVELERRVSNRRDEQRTCEHGPGHDELPRATRPSTIAQR
jgi:hypothetical protein